MPKTIFDETYIRLIENLVSQRKEKKLRQIEVAEKLGWDQSYLSKVERCVRRLDVLEYFQICDALGIERKNAFEMIENVLSEVRE
ncbi:MAG: helix-turn-helix transcriptional regulator [Rhodospirillales bacterium]